MLTNRLQERMRPRLNERHSSTTAVQKHSQMRSMDQNHRMGTRGPASRSRNHGKGQNIFLSPEKGENRRPRRNSESSIAEKRPNVDNERRRRERRYRDGETVNSSGKRREHASSRAKKPKGLDLIDKLDVTGIYGPGCKSQRENLSTKVSLINVKHPFTMTDRSMLAILTGIAKKIIVRRCMLSRQALPIMPLVGLGR